MIYIALYLYVCNGLFYTEPFIPGVDCSTIFPEVRGGVYKTLQTKGPAGRKITGFFSRLISEKEVYNVVELDINRGESITITCPTHKGGLGKLFPSSLTTYYRSLPESIGSLNVVQYSEDDLLNELLVEGDELLGLLEDITNSLILVPYGEYSRRLTFLWKGDDVAETTHMNFLCLKEYVSTTTYQPLALIVVRVVADKPSIGRHVIDLSWNNYIPKHHDMVYTKEYSPLDVLDVKCSPNEYDKAEEKWKLVDLRNLPHNILTYRADDELLYNQTWSEDVNLIDADIILDLENNVPIKIISRDLSSMFYTSHGSFYINCTREIEQLNRVFNLVANTVATLDLLKPEELTDIEDEPNANLERTFHFTYNVIDGKAVALYCPITTHTLKPNSLNKNKNNAFEKELFINIPNTRISRRGSSLIVLDFSNTSALNSVVFQIMCTSRDSAFTSYVFSLTNRMSCIFDDNRKYWRPCKVVLFPSEELTVRCPRKSEKEYYGLMPKDQRDSYIMVDYSFVKDRHSSLHRTVESRPSGDIHKIKFLSNHNRILMRDEVHYECGNTDHSHYNPSGNLPIVIIKLVGKLEKIDETGHPIISVNDLVKPFDAPKLFHVLLDAGMTVVLNCKSFFLNDEPLILYPAGKDEVFDDIPRFFNGLILSKQKGSLVYQTRAIQGLTVRKFPFENPSSVELQLAKNYQLTSGSDNALYFLCARNDLWADKTADVAVIQVYIPTTTPDLYGSSPISNLFLLDDEYASSTDNYGVFNILHHQVIALHCPKMEGAINIPQCLDLKGSSGYSEEGPVPDVANVIDNTDVSSAKSLWFLHTKALKQLHAERDVDVICYCLSESGDLLATVRLTTVSDFAASRTLLGTMVIIIAITSGLI